MASKLDSSIHMQSTESLLRNMNELRNILTLFPKVFSFHQFYIIESLVCHFITPAKLSDFLCTMFMLQQVWMREKNMPTIIIFTYFLQHWWCSIFDAFINNMVASKVTCVPSRFLWWYIRFHLVITSYTIWPIKIERFDAFDAKINALHLGLNLLLYDKN